MLRPGGRRLLVTRESVCDCIGVGPDDDLRLAVVPSLLRLQLALAILSALLGGDVLPEDPAKVVCGRVVDLHPVIFTKLQKRLLLPG